MYAAASSQLRFWPRIQTPTTCRGAGARTCKSSRVPIRRWRNELSSRGQRRPSMLWRFPRKTSSYLWASVAVAILVFVAGCSRSQVSTTAAAAPAKPKLGIRPNGDTEIQPDMSKITNEDLKKVFSYIDQHIDDHVENLQK